MQAIGAFPNSTEPRLVDAREPEGPRVDEVLCRTVRLGVCGTDRDILESAQPMVPHGEPFLVLGHECLGQIERVGKDISGLSPGDYVVPVVRRAFDVRTLRPDMLPFGTFTERGIVHEHGFSAPRWIDRPRYLFRVPAEIREIAVFTEPMSVAEKGINEALAVQRGRLGDATSANPCVLITGLGPIAFACLVACRCRGWPATVYGRDDENTFRARLVQDFGGRYVSERQFDANPSDVERDGFDMILECTGSDEVLMHVATALASCGVMVWLGSCRRPEPRVHNLDVLMRNAVLRNHIHLGIVNAAPRDFEHAIAHLQQLHRECPNQMAALFTAQVSLPEVLWHCKHRQPQGIKTVVRYD
jgi:threonine dehydrogenase-like Zn-dependent dehydrogenase